MRQKSDLTGVTPKKLVRDIRRATRKQYSAHPPCRAVASAGPTDPEDARHQTIDVLSLV
jgi:hypothetical protein